MFGLNKLFGPPLHIKLINEINEEKLEIKEALNIHTPDPISLRLRADILIKIRANIEVLAGTLDIYNVKFHNSNLSKSKLIKVLNNPLPFESKGFVYYSKYLNTLDNNYTDKIKKLDNYHTFFDKDIIVYKKLYSQFKFFEDSQLNENMRKLYFKKFLDKILTEINVHEPGLSEVIKNNLNKNIEYNKITMLEFIKVCLRFLELHKKLINNELQNLEFYIIKSSEKELLKMIKCSKNFKGMILVKGVK